jgi:hypothetical protein
MHVFLEGVLMTVAQITFTQHVTHVLRNIAHSRRTGLLRIEPVGAQKAEKGEIFFEGGHVVYTRAGRQAGETALLSIVGWNQAYYSFFEGTQSPRRKGGSSSRFLPTVKLLPATQREERQMALAGLPAIVQVDSSVIQSARNTATSPHFLDASFSSIEEAVNQGVHAVFHVRSAAATKQVMSQMERQDRLIFMLLDGKRTVRDLAQLIHRSELAVARILARLLNNGYIECARPNSH